MTFIQLLVLLVFIAFAILITVIPAMVTVSKIKDDWAKRFAKRWFVVVISAFLAGAIIRGIQEDTGIVWLNGFVPIFGGLFVASWGVPFFWDIFWLKDQAKLNIFKSILLILAGLLFTLLGLGIIYLGLTQLLGYR